MTAQYLHGDCREVMRTLEAESVDAIVTDPPYGLSFMGKDWDHGIPGVPFWTAALRVAKPGAHLLAFGGTRTFHRLVCAIEDAGWEIRDTVLWIYGSGFPKSLDVSKAIDKARDDTAAKWEVADFLRPHVERVGFDVVSRHFGFLDETMARARWTSHSQTNTPTWDQWLDLKRIIGFGDEMDAEVWRLNGRKGTPGEAWATAEVLAVDRRMNEASGIVSAGRDERVDVERQIKAANSDAARQWQGWGTALKPAVEMICLARKPLVGTVAANVLAHGTGAINIDGCRVPANDKTPSPIGQFVGSTIGPTGHSGVRDDASNMLGRWPANVIHDGSDEVLAAFPDAKSRGEYTHSLNTQPTERQLFGSRFGVANRTNDYAGDTDSAARFFYTAKASQDDRNFGCSGIPKQLGPECGVRTVEPGKSGGYGAPRANHHPTVKPTDLMRYLCRLITPPGGLVLDPFMGSGSTGVAAKLEHFRFIGIEQDDAYIEIARNRVHHTQAQVAMFA